MKSKSCFGVVSIGVAAVLVGACEAGRVLSPSALSAPVPGLTSQIPAVSTLGTGAGKSALFNSDPATCAGGAANTSGPTFGFVVLNTNASGDVLAQVFVEGGSPDVTYSIWINQDPGDCPTVPTATLTTNGQGNGTGHASKVRVPGATTFWVSAQEEPYVAGKQILRSVAVVLD